MAAITSSDKWTFFYKFLQSPRVVGSVVPSSSALTRRMLRPVDWTEIRSIAELGAGTGVFTKAIRASVRPGTKVAVFEKEEVMRRRLTLQFQEFSCFENAEDLSGAIRSLGLSGVDCIVSGLPFANFPVEQREKIMDEVQASLRSGGPFITFQYSLQMKSMLQERFASVRISFVPWNFPPAFVYVCTN